MIVYICCIRCLSLLYRLVALVICFEHYQEQEYRLLTPVFERRTLAFHTHSDTHIQTHTFRHTQTHTDRSCCIVLLAKWFEGVNAAVSPSGSGSRVMAMLKRPLPRLTRCGRSAWNFSPFPVSIKSSGVLCRRGHRSHRSHDMYVYIS